ncbi:MAG: hypothetical protein M0R77_06395 [Gammaproteobacteria bacterium]|nr:hypothetical protein [Gammaproteobacteria bacterium]
MAGPTDKPVGSEAESRTRNVAEATRSEAERIAKEASAAGRDIMDRQRASFASEIDGIVKALYRTAGALRDEHQDSVAHYAQRAADGLSDFSRKLRDEDLGSLVDRINGYARRQPGVFLGGAVAAGFMLSRFLKSGQGEYHRASAAKPYPEQTSSPYTTHDVEEGSLVHPNEPLGPTAGEHLP